MLKKILNTESIEQPQRLNEMFSVNKPFKHIVIDGFFKPEVAESMLEEFPLFDEKLVKNENGEVGRKAAHEKVSGIGPSYKMLDNMAKSPDFLHWVEQVTGIDNLIYDPYYFGGGTHNNLSGQDLDPHVDFTHHPITGHHRRLNLIVYLNKEWNSSWGGNIEFHKNPRLEPKHDEIISVEPLFNRAVIFETNNISWHGFPRINIPADKGSLSRKSFALYYYTDQRDQQIKPHSTIYVERHLPKKYHAGMTIDNDQLAEIKTLLARRDQHLERLYNNITHLMTEVRDLKWSLGQANHKIKSAESKPVEVSGQLASTNQANDTDESWEKAELLSRIKELENSTSWRITAPLRKLKKWFSREQ